MGLLNPLQFDHSLIDNIVYGAEYISQILIYKTYLIYVQKKVCEGEKERDRETKTETETETFNPIELT